MEKPKIRFKGYQEDWEQRKVTELLKNSSLAMKIGPFGSALKKEYFVEEGIKVYAQENAFTGDFSMGDYYITEDKYKELKSCELYPGDLVISMMGTIGACAIFPKNAEKGIMNSHLLRLQFNNEVIPEYIMYLLRDSVLIRKQIDRLSVGSIMSGLSSSVVKKLVFPIPKLAEQKRIVEYLDSIDRLITLHQRKCEEMKTLKKYMLQKMFPQNGQLVPQIRFSGFTEDWEQRKLGDVADVTKLAGFEFTEHVVYSDEGNIIALRGLNIKNGQLILDDVKYIDGSNFSKLSRSKLFIDDIMFTYVGTVGEVAIIKENDRFYLAPNVSRIRVKSDDSPKFISHYMRTDNFKNKIIFPLIATSSQPALSMENIRKFTINIPINKEEQDCLAKYFDSLDHLITLHQQKCDELRNIKKFMLQNMFI